MRYTRSQCSKLFGISMDTLRYYENIGLLQVERDVSSRNCYYSEQQIMQLLDYRKFKSLGLNNDMLPTLLSGNNVPTHKDLFSNAVAQLQEQISELTNRISYVHSMNEVFDSISSNLNVIQIGMLPEREFLLFNRENESLISIATQGLPFLNYAYWIDRECLLGQKEYSISLAIDIRTLMVCRPELYKQLHESGKTLVNGNGMKVYCYRFYPSPQIIQPEDLDPLIEYAKEHHFQIKGDVFGGILGPEIIGPNNQKGYIITQTLEIE